MIETNNPEINVDEIMERIREEVAKRKAMVSDENDVSNLPYFDTQPDENNGKNLFSECPDMQPPNFSVDAEFKQKKQYHVNELLKFHDDEFVTNAYRAILGREPDQDGMNLLLSRLRQGKSTKIEILGRLRFTPEGRRNKIAFQGMLLSFAVQSAFKIPILGYIFRVIIGIINLPAIIKNILRIETSIFIHRNEFRQSSNEVYHKLSMLRNHVSEFQNFVSDRLDEKIEKNNAIKQIKIITDAIDSIIKSKADAKNIVELHDALKTKADVSRIDELYGVLESKAAAKNIDEIHKALAIKADASRIDEIYGILESKAEIKTAFELRKDVNDAENKINDAENKINDAENKINDAENKINDAENKIKNEINDEENKINDLILQTRDHKYNITDQHRRISLFLEEARKGFPEPIPEAQIENMLSEENHLLDAMYVSFEDRFRGTRNDIKNRQKVYLPYIYKAVQKTDNNKILDVGCGRGEWLEILKEHGYKNTQGIDINHVMITQCEDIEFDVILGDAIEYLHKKPANTLSAITGFHIIEHLPLKIMITLLDESLRVLKPGGIVIFETPNPENIIVSTCSFYMDPSHRNPLPPDTMKFLIEQRGFINPEIIRSSPLRFLDYKKDNELKELVKLFNKEQDYAVIGHKA
jgi:O-antigen chain-terminating methyltransferase